MSGSVAGRIPFIYIQQNFPLGSSRRYMASNFTDVIMNAQLHHVKYEWDAKKCSKQAAAETRSTKVLNPRRKYSISCVLRQCACAEIGHASRVAV